MTTLHTCCEHWPCSSQFLESSALYALVSHLCVNSYLSYVTDIAAEFTGSEELLPLCIDATSVDECKDIILVPVYYCI